MDMAMKKLTGTLLFFVFCIFVCTGCSNKTGEINEKESDRLEQYKLVVIEPSEFSAMYIDVASPKWQNFIIDELGKQYADMGLDGLFLDNADVFYYHPAEDIFLGLCAIMQGLRKYGLKLIVNGGDCFVSKCMEKDIALTLFDGVNQETVFTSIDFENQSYGAQSEEETAYLKKYLAKVKEYGLSVCLLEYGADRSLSGKIDAYCSENNFLWYKD